MRLSAVVRGVVPVRPGRACLGVAVLALVAATASGCAGGATVSACGLCGPTLVSPDGTGVVLAQGRTLWRFDASGAATGPVGLLPTRRGRDAQSLVVERGVAWIGAGPRTIRVAADGSLTRTSRHPDAYVMDMSAARGRVWLAAGRRVFRLDASGAVAARSARLQAGAWALTRTANAVLVAGGPLRTVRGRWRPAGPGYLLALDPRTLRRRGRRSATTPWPRAAVAVGGAVWLAGDRGRLQRIAPGGRRRTVAAPGAEFLARGAGALWTLTTGGVLQCHDARTGAPVGAPLALHAETTSLAAAAGAVWVGLRDGGVTRIDAARRVVVWTRRVPIT